MNKELRKRHPEMDNHGNLRYVTDVEVGLKFGPLDRSITFTVTTSRIKNITNERWIATIDSFGTFGIGETLDRAELALLQQMIFAVPSFNRERFIPLITFGENLK